MPASLLSGILREPAQNIMRLPPLGGVVDIALVVASVDVVAVADALFSTVIGVLLSRVIDATTKTSTITTTNIAMAYVRLATITTMCLIKIEGNKRYGR